MLSDNEDRALRCPRVQESLNAPYGARCFLTRQRHHVVGWVQLVLMHLMALGAF